MNIGSTFNKNFHNFLKTILNSSVKSSLLKLWNKRFILKRIHQKEKKRIMKTLHRRSIVAPCSRRTFTISLKPFSAAKWRGVSRFLWREGFKKWFQKEQTINHHTKKKENQNMLLKIRVGSAFKKKFHKFFKTFLSSFVKSGPSTLNKKEV